MYLGDGYISPMKKRWRLRIVLDDRYPALIRETSSAMVAVLDGVRPTRVQKKGCTEVGAYSAHWPCLFPQMGPGKKHERDVSLQAWQSKLVAAHPKALLRGLVHSDGDRHLNTVRRGDRTYAYPRYGFTNSSEQILDLFTDTCDLLGVRWTRTRPNRIAVSRAEDVAALDAFIGPKK